MRINKLILNDYRNINNLNILFDNNLTILYGNNGQGKTNIVESIYLLSKANSFRTNYFKELIQDGKEESSIEGEIQFKKQSKKQKIILTKAGRACFVNDISINKISDYLQNMSAVCFSPEDVILFKDSPKERRRFLDSELSSLFPLYIKQLILFKKVLEQRNDLLKNNNYDKFLLEVLDDKIVETSYDVFIRRKWLMNKISDIASLINKEVFNKDSVIKFSYNTYLDEDDKEKYYEKAKKILQDNLIKDLRYQFTGIGIHKDDFKAYIDEKPIDVFASQGQQRMMALLLKLATMEIIARVNKEEPILILDDAFSELDKEKKENLFNYISNKHQVFITCTDYKEVLPNKLKKKNTIILIENGIIVERKVI